MHNLFELNQEHLVFVKLLIAHFIADFVLQSDKMVKNKKWFSKEMFSHIGIVYVTAALFSFLWWQSIIITVLHFFIDGIKIEFKKKEYFKKNDTQLFLLDQVGHILTILVVWVFVFDKKNEIIHSINWLTSQSYFILITLGYLCITYPLGYLIGIATGKINGFNKKGDKALEAKDKKEEKTDKNGFYIGVFERIIILTFVLLGEYEAIGFLITGKSLLRFTSRDEHKKSEYVLLGTMMSYSITIVFGILLKQLI